MSILCSDFQNWTIITMLAILTVCIVGMNNLVFSQTPENTTGTVTEEANRLINEAVRGVLGLDPLDDPNTPFNESTINYTQRIEQRQTMNAIRQTYEFIINSCYEHSDRPNPVQDLIDKGFLAEEIWKGETCKSVKQMYDMTRQ